jgi:hypothetical protein
MSELWDGVTRAETLHEWVVEARHELADAAKRYDWKRVLALLDEHPRMVNACRLGGQSLYTPLHQVAHGGGPAEVVRELLARGAWRTARSSRGERPVDVARSRKHATLVAALEPELKRQVPADVLAALQKQFHEVIASRADDLVRKHALRLPELEPLLELDEPAMWFPIPGMYGGFSFRLAGEGANAELIAESWCRVAGGSGQRHRITPSAWTLVDEGFV